MDHSRTPGGDDSTDAPHDTAHRTAHGTPHGTPATPTRWLNLGILAHVDAGKTSLTEALLELGGAIPARGQVDAGTTQTDSTAIERRRGITVRAAVATLRVGDLGINIIDTPGHPDFIAEVERSLAVLDGAVLVVSAVEGVQAQTIILHRALRRLGVPTLVFVNKLDRSGADPDRVLEQVHRRLGVRPVRLDGWTGLAERDRPAMGEALADGPDFAVSPDPVDAPDLAPSGGLTSEELRAVLAEHDDALLAEWVDGAAPETPRLWRSLRELTARGTVMPALCGSARTTAGVLDLIETIDRTLPASAADASGSLAGQVFAIERGADSARVCTVRMRSGTLGIRDRIAVGPGPGHGYGDGPGHAIVTGLEVHRPGGARATSRASAGQVVRIRGLDEARIGDWIGERPHEAGMPSFPPPSMQVTVSARDAGEQIRLMRALTELADADPLIGLSTAGPEIRLRLYGPVQQEVIAETLSTEHGIEASFSEPGMVCIERPAGVGAAVLRRGEPGHLDQVTLGLRVEPAVPGSGHRVRIAAERSTLPLHVYGTIESYRRAIAEYLEVPLSSGLSHWQVTDTLITVTESGYIPPSPQPAEVRRTAARVLRMALEEAGTRVCEPVDRLRVEFPTSSTSAVMELLGRCGASPVAHEVTGEVTVVEATVRTAGLETLRRQLHGASHGQAVLESELDHYVPVRRGR